MLTESEVIIIMAVGGATGGELEMHDCSTWEELYIQEER